MSREKSLLKPVSIAESGRLHYCRQSRSHALPKGEPVFIVKDGRDERHYCIGCGLKFVNTAIERLDALKQELTRADGD